MWILSSRLRHVVRMALCTTRTHRVSFPRLTIWSIEARYSALLLGSPPQPTPTLHHLPFLQQPTGTVRLHGSTKSKPEKVERPGLGPARIAVVSKSTVFACIQTMFSMSMFLQGLRGQKLNFRQPVTLPSGNRSGKGNIGIKIPFWISVHSWATELSLWESRGNPNCIIYRLYKWQ